MARCWSVTGRRGRSTGWRAAPDILEGNSSFRIGEEWRHGKCDGVEAGADPGPRLGRRPYQALLHRTGRLQRGLRPPGQRVAPLRAADAARLCVLDLDRNGPRRLASGVAAGP